MTDQTKISGVTPPAAPRVGGLPRDLRESSQEFEGLFIAQMIQAMRRTVPETGLLGGGDGQQVFRDMFDHELALRIARTGGFGIGEALYRQLSAEPARKSSEEKP